MTPGVPAEPPLLAGCAALLLAFTVVASIDGLYLHLYRYRLYERPASRREHRLHTVNAVLFPPLTYLLFCAAPLGGFLWLAAVLFALSFAVEIADVRCEYASRAGIGGLSRGEYLMHFLMAALRFGAVTPLLLCAPLAAWGLEHTALVPRPQWLRVLGLCIALPGVGAGLVHVLLDWKGRPRAS